MRYGGQGFTLIELMTSIVIIGIVFGVVITAALSARKNGRDTQRQSDLRTIQGALEQYKADVLFYPPASGLSFGSAFTFGGKTYLNNVPDDPISGQNGHYSYQAIPANCDNATNGNCVNYCLAAKLEVVPNPAPTQPTQCTAAAPPNYNLWVTQP